MYCDMHAHSRRHNIFIYGCENKRNPEKKLTEQVFPLMLHKNVADKVSQSQAKGPEQVTEGKKRQYKKILSKLSSCATSHLLDDFVKISSWVGGMGIVGFCFESLFFFFAFVPNIFN